MYILFLCMGSCTDTPVTGGGYGFGGKCFYVKAGKLSAGTRDGAVDN